MTRLVRATLIALTFTFITAAAAGTHHSESSRPITCRNHVCTTTIVDYPPSRPHQQSLDRKS